MADSLYKNEREISARFLVQSEMKRIVNELKFKPAEDRQYVPRITIVQRERTPEEIEREEIAKKYNL